MKSKNMYNKIMAFTVSLVIVAMSIAPVNGLAGTHKSFGDFLKQAPRGSQRVLHGNIQYMVHEGRFYKPGRGGYVYTRPPRGLILKGLPLAATRLVMAGITYYVVDDIYYHKIPSGYQVVDTPPSVVVVNSIEPGAQAVVKAKALNVRSGPGLGQTVQSRVYSGDLLIVQSSAADWLYVQLPDNRYGWVMTCYVSITDTGAKG